MSKLLPAFDGQKVTIATVDISIGSQYPTHAFAQVPDFNRSEPLKIIKGFCQIFTIVYRSKARYVMRVILLKVSIQASLPNRPAGRTISTRTMITNTTMLEASG